MYSQSLLTVLTDHIKPHVLKRNNKSKKWEYGYNKEHDVIVISKTGQIGEVYEIQNLKIALPLFKGKLNKDVDHWQRQEYPKELKNDLKDSKSENSLTLKITPTVFILLLLTATCRALNNLLMYF